MKLTPPAFISQFISHPLIRQMFMFGVVGVIGFVVDTAVLYTGLAIGLGYYGGRVLSYLSAATVTWFLNRRWTFTAQKSQNKKREWGRFLFFNLGGFAANYGAYAASLETWPLAVTHPVIAVAIGSLAGMVVNFSLNKWLVFKS